MAAGQKLNAWQDAEAQAAEVTAAVYLAPAQLPHLSSSQFQE